MQVSVMSSYTGGLLTVTKVPANSGDLITPGTAIFADTTLGSFNLCLPLVPIIGSHVQVIDSGNNFPINNLTIMRNGALIGGLQEDLAIDTSNIIDLFYMGAAYGWRVSIGGASQTLPYQPSTVSFSANKGGVSDQAAFASSSWVKLTLTTKEWDTNLSYDTVNSRFITTIPGKYNFIAGLRFGSAFAATIGICFYKNGTQIKELVYNQTNGQNSIELTTILDLSLGDYLEVYACQYSGSTVPISAYAMDTFFQGFLVTANPNFSLVSYAPTDISLRTSDYPLKAGETVYKTYSAAINVPLNIATLNGEYEISISNNYVASSNVGNSYLAPNNTGIGTTSFAVVQSYTNGSNDTIGAGHWTWSSISIGDGQILKTVMRITTAVARKSASVDCILYAAQNKRYKIVAICSDITTLWTSLGTITFAFAHTGQVVIRRIL